MSAVPLLTSQGISNEPLVEVVIYHDQRPWSSKGLAEDGSPAVLQEVYRCQAPAAADRDAVLDSCFEEFNVGETSGAAQQYRLAGLRSLSTGDVVRIGEVAYRCDSFGWSRFPGVRS